MTLGFEIEEFFIKGVGGAWVGPGKNFEKKSY